MVHGHYTIRAEHAKQLQNFRSHLQLKSSPKGRSGSSPASIRKLGDWKPCCFVWSVASESCTNEPRIGRFAPSDSAPWPTLMTPTVRTSPDAGDARSRETATEVKQSDRRVGLGHSPTRSLAPLHQQAARLPCTRAALPRRRPEARRPVCWNVPRQSKGMSRAPGGDPRVAPRHEAFAPSRGQRWLAGRNGARGRQIVMRRR